MVISDTGWVAAPPDIDYEVSVYEMSTYNQRVGGIVKDRYSATPTEPIRNRAALQLHDLLPKLAARPRNAHGNSSCFVREVSFPSEESGLPNGTGICRVPRRSASRGHSAHERRLLLLGTSLGNGQTSPIRSPISCSSRSQGYLRVSTRALLSDTYRNLGSLITQRSLVQIQAPQPIPAPQPSNTLHNTTTYAASALEVSRYGAGAGDVGAGFPSSVSGSMISVRVPSGSKLLV
jgi:hypothetical protein